MKKYSIVIIFLLMTVALIQATAQNAEKETGPFATAMSFICTSTSNDSILLKVQISVKHETGATNLANAPVLFSVAGTESDIELGTVKTDLRGTAIMKVPALNQYPRNEEQMINFKAVFAGIKNYEGSDGEFALKPSKLVLSFYEEDSIKYVKVEGSQYNADGTVTPLGPIDLAVGVQKMLSVLKVADISLDSTGVGTAEFPLDIIGDTLGNLIVIATIDEHEVYGYVKVQSNIGWGLQKHLISPDRPSRELWTPIAPLWMIITLIIMLLGVWGHYVYAVVQLVLIKKSSKKKAKEEDEEETAKV
ncbi:MAG: hypothetical protein IPH45_07555 [Bacteroidales bacterium]|nr:hypothetical protein [Bacteroidales bacterium]